MAEASRGRVTITLGSGSKVVKRAGALPDVDFFDSRPVSGNKRSVRDRLGSSVDRDGSFLHGSQVNSKRQRGDGFGANQVDDFRVGIDDLRLKLMQKNGFRRIESDNNQKDFDLRQKLSRMGRPPLNNYEADQCRPDSRDIREQRRPESRDIREQRRPEARDIREQYRPEPRDIREQRRPESRDIREHRRLEARDIREQYRPELRDIREQYRPEPRDIREQRRPESRDIKEHHRPESRDISTLQRYPSTRDAVDFPSVGSSRSSYSSWTLEHIRRRSPERVMHASRGLSPPRNVEELPRRPINRTYDDARAVSYVSKDVPGGQRSMGASFPVFAKETISTVSAKPAPPVPPRLNQIPPPSSIMAKPLCSVEEQLTVDGFLQSIGLGKFAIIFKAEEVDMAALKQMRESDLKELGIPMGPRKKIILALLPRNKRQQP